MEGGSNSAEEKGIYRRLFYGSASASFWKTGFGSASEAQIRAYTYKFQPFHQCCGSGMFIPDSDFYPSLMSDPGLYNNKKDGGRGGGFVVLPFF
jgi:hypothetical protein